MTCNFMSVLTVIKLYQDDERMTINPRLWFMVEKILPRVGLEFEAARSVGEQATVAPKLHIGWQI